MKRNLKLSQIKLDQKNPRFATRKNKEQNIANFMLKHTSLSQINEMVIDIAKNGLSPLDIIGVFKEKDDFIALDGNRRVLALKILFENENMNLNKKTIEVLGEYKKLADANVKKEEIEVFVFKNRDDVKKWLERKHTSDFGGASHKDWPTFERKIFQNDKLALFISENASEANISYDDYAINVKYTIWERFFKSEFSREWLGVSYDKESKEFTRENKNKLFERMIAITNATKDKFLNFQSVNKK